MTIGLNIAIRGVANIPATKFRRIATARAEHKSVLELVRYLCRRKGYEWIELEADRFGSIIPESAGSAAEKGVDLICISHGNGETGCLNDLEQISSAVQGGSLLLFDVSQTAAYMDLTPARSADLLVLSGHKLYGPRGTAVLRKKRGLELMPLLIGAGQQNGLVPGTEDVPGAVGLGVAARLTMKERDKRRSHVEALSKRFWEILSDRVPNIELNGHPTQRVPGNLSITVPHVPAELLIRQLPQISMSMASACTGVNESHVLKALGFSKARIASTFRVGFNAFNTIWEAEEAGDKIATVVSGLQRKPR